MEETNRRINNIEIAITELTTLNKSQEANAARQANSIEKILGYLQDMAVLRTMVNNNGVDLEKLSSRVELVYKEIDDKETRMQKEINSNKEELSFHSSNRLVKSIMIAAAISTFLFGYLYLDFHRAEREVTGALKTINVDLKGVSAGLEQNRGKILEIDRSIGIYKDRK